jgi:CubicO group peptidase (beta-lactamase class C family)
MRPQARVTLRELLTHSAGVNVHGFAGYEAGAALPTLVQVLNGEKPANNDPIRVDTVPGKTWRYSGGGYEIAQQVVMDVTGIPFPTFMQHVVLKPLGMTHSTYQQPLPPKLLAQVALAYRADGTPVTGGPHVYPELAAAALWTTPSDLARYAIGVQQALSGKSQRVLTAGYIRADGLMIHDMYVRQVKSPQESKYPWDYYKVVKVMKGEEAFGPITGLCPLAPK